MSSTFSRNLRRLRKEQGLSVKELSTAVGLEYATYLNYENTGREPKYNILTKIALILDVSVDELLGISREHFAHDRFDFYTGLQNLSAMLDAEKVHWSNVGRFDVRDREELSSLLKYVHARAKDMAYREVT